MPRPTPQIHRKEVFPIATTRIMPLHIGKGRTLSKALNDILDYVQDPEKTEDGHLVSCHQCSAQIAAAEFLLSKKNYATRTGRDYGKSDIIAYQVRQSFAPGEVTPEEANRIGVEFAQRFTKGGHAFIVCTHVDKHHVHNHIIWNSTSLDCTRKFKNFWRSSKAVRRLSDTLCVEHGLSVVPPNKSYGQAYNKWLGNVNRPTLRGDVCAAIDAALEQHPATLDELLSLLEQAGCKVRRGKVPSIAAPGWKRAARLDTLGEEYTVEALAAVFAGEKIHRPRKKAAPSRPEKKVNLLVDIQAKLQAGRGPGYERWAKVFNLKQMAQTINYLTEHDFLDYNDLEQKTAAVTGQFHALGDEIKTIEKRMAEIAVLRTHIVNYSKTRSTYVTYRKAGYSKKFLAEHEAEITLHKAAKAAFDSLGIDKLPTVKSLQAEYAELLSRKKTIYPEYAATRQKMRDLQTAKANVDRLLDKDAQDREQDKSRDKASQR